MKMLEETTVKPVLRGHSKIDITTVLKTIGRSKVLQNALLEH